MFEDPLMSALDLLHTYTPQHALTQTCIMYAHLKSRHMIKKKPLSINYILYIELCSLKADQL